MSKQGSPTSDSLELLLDTICNTFGGVVFIALLVVVMLRLSPTKEISAPAREKSLNQATEKWQIMISEHLNSLGELIKKKKENPPEWEPVILESLENLIQLEREKIALHKSVGDILLTTASIRKEGQQIKKTANQLQKSRKQVVQLNRQLDDEIEKEKSECDDLSTRVAVLMEQQPEQTRISRPVGLPYAQIDTNRQVGLFLKYGRVYFTHQWNKGINPNRTGPNIDDFHVQPGMLWNVAKPLPHKGIPIDAGGASSEKLNQELVRFPAQNWYIALIVAKDSFDYFQSVKNQVLNLGYRYQVILLNEGKSVMDNSDQAGRSQ